MERCIMFLDLKDQCCKNDYASKHNLQIQFNPYQTASGTFQRTRKKKFHNFYGNTKDPK